MYTINTQTPTLPRTHSHLPKQTLTLPTCTVSLTTIAHSHTTHTENMHTLPENKQGGHEPSITRSVSISINPVQAYSADGKAAPPPHIPALYCTVRKALLAAVSLSLDSLKWSPLPPPPPTRKITSSSQPLLQWRPDTEQELSAWVPAHHSPQRVNQPRPSWASTVCQGDDRFTRGQPHHEPGLCCMSKTCFKSTNRDWHV